jgi:hypothetical protein
MRAPLSPWRGAAWLAALLLSAPAMATEYRLKLSPEFTRGRAAEGHAATTLLPVELTASGEKGWLGLRLPFADVSGGGGFVSGLGAVEGQGRRRGLGDLRVTLAHHLLGGEEGAPYLDIALRTSLPSATAPGLGAGQVEHLLRLDAGLDLAPGLALDVSLGRRLVPFPRQGRAGVDYWTFQGSVTRTLPGGWSLGLGVDAQDRLPDAARPVVELGATIEREMTADTTIGLFAWKGVTAESALFSLGLRLSVRLQ